MKISSKDELLKAIHQGESDTLEFKSKITDPKLLAILICAFQNTYGGHIVIGLNEASEIVGVDTNTALNVYGRAKKLIEPYDISTFDTIEVDGKHLAVITVDASMTRIVGLKVDGISYQRTGAAVRPITAKTIINKIKSAIPEDNVELPHITDLALKIEELNKRLIKAGSWKSKAIDIVIGGVFGALISIAIGSLLG